MKVDAIRLDLRPRTMFEACDLGVRIVSAHARSVWSTCLPVYALVVLISLMAWPFGTGWAFLALFWLKPWFDRSVLFVLGRAVFGETTRFADLVVARRAVLWQGLAGALSVRRLSPWRSFVQPVLQLEGQRGKPGRQRIARILGPHRGAALGMQSAFATAEACLWAGLWTLPGWLLPTEARGDWLQAFFRGESSWTSMVLLACQMGAVLAVEPFFVGAGFAMYLNRRVELEAWDIEQEFRHAFTA